MSEKLSDPRKCVFAIIPLEDGTPMLSVGIPEAAWEHLRQGNTAEFDLRSVGLPIAVSLSGGKDQASLLALLEEGAKAAGVEVRKDLGKDYGIPKPRSH